MMHIISYDLIHMDHIIGIYRISYWGYIKIWKVLMLSLSEFLVSCCHLRYFNALSMSVLIAIAKSIQLEDLLHPPKTSFRLRTGFCCFLPFFFSSEGSISWSILSSADEGSPDRSDQMIRLMLKYRKSQTGPIGPRIPGSEKILGCHKDFLK